MQKFNHGDLVHIAAHLGSRMGHFRADVDAIVIASYAEQFGGGNRRDYTVHIKGCGKVSWYGEEQLTLIKHDQLDLLTQWEKAEQDEATEKGNLDWIFQHGEEVLEKPHGASLEALAKCLDINLWGLRGEGYIYYVNAIQVLAVAKPFLLSRNKDEWLNVTFNVKARTRSGPDRTR